MEVELTCPRVRFSIACDAILGRAAACRFEKLLRRARFGTLFANLAIDACSIKLRKL